MYLPIHISGSQNAVSRGGLFLFSLPVVLNVTSRQINQWPSEFQARSALASRSHPPQYLPFHRIRQAPHVSVTDRLTKVGLARQIKEVLDVQYSHAHRVTLVMDNLNTHSPAPYTKVLNPVKHGVFSIDSRCTTRQSTAAG